MSTSFGLRALPDAACPAALQCVVDSGTHTRSLTRATETKAAVLADAQSRAAWLATEMSSLHGRSRELAQHLAEQTAAREVRPLAVAPCIYPLVIRLLFSDV